MKKFYAVQHGSEFDWDYGSYVYSDALPMAESLHDLFPGEEIRIATIEEDTSFCEGETVVFEGSRE